jgi:hypothetical protein
MGHSDGGSRVVGCAHRVHLLKKHLYLVEQKRHFSHQWLAQYTIVPNNRCRNSQVHAYRTYSG